MFFSKSNKDIDQKIKELNAKAFIAVPHINGLPIAENTWCQLFYCEDKIVIIANNTTFNLLLSKVKDITTKTDVEITKHLVSSAGGAVVGGLAFGVLGALIGGRVQTKKSKEITPYLIVTYETEEIKYLAFDVTGTPKSNNFVELFSKRPKEETTITL